MCDEPLVEILSRLKVDAGASMRTNHIRVERTSERDVGEVGLRKRGSEQFRNLDLDPRLARRKVSRLGHVRAPPRDSRMTFATSLVQWAELGRSSHG